MALSTVEFQAQFTDEMTGAINKAFSNFQKRIKETDDALEDHTDGVSTYGQLWKSRGKKALMGGAKALKVVGKGLKAVATLTLAAGAAFLAAIKFVADFETAILNTRDGVGFAAGELQATGDVATDLGLKLSTSRGHILDISAALRHAGISTREEGVQILEFATKLSVASGASADETARYVTTLTKGFKLSYTEMRKVSNAMLDIGSKTGQSVAETESLFQVSKEYLQFLPKSLRTKALTSIAAMGGALSEMRINAEDAMAKVGEMMDISSAEGNKFKSAISQFMQIPIGQINDALQKGRPDLLFAKMQAQVQKMKEPTGVMVSHMKALGGASFVNIFKGLQEGPDIMKSMAVGAGKAAEEQAVLDQMFSETTASLGNFWQSIKNVFIPVLHNTVKPLMDWLTPKFKEAAKWVEKFYKNYDINVQPIIDRIMEVFSSGIEFWKEVGLTVAGWSVDVWQGMKRIPEVMYEGVLWWKEKIGEWWASMKTWGTEWFSWMKAKLTRVWANILDFLKIKAAPYHTEAEAEYIERTLAPAGQPKTRAAGGFVETAGTAIVHAGETIVPPAPTLDFPSLMGSPVQAADIAPIETAPRKAQGGGGTDMGPVIMLLRELVSLVRSGQKDPDTMPPGMATGAGPLGTWGL